MSDDDRDRLISQISSVLGELDKESLAFLKEQADVLLYNKQVREKNARIAEIMEQETLSSESSDEDFSDENKKSREAVEKGSSPVRFEQLKNEKFFNLCIGSARIFMDHKEVVQLLKIALASESADEGASRLYNWFKRERNDALVDGHIGSPGNRALRLIYKELLDTFEAT